MYFSRRNRTHYLRQLRALLLLIIAVRHAAQQRAEPLALLRKPHLVLLADQPPAEATLRRATTVPQGRTMSRRRMQTFL